MDEHDNKENKTSTYYMMIGGAVFLILFILIALSKYTINNALDKTEDVYSVQNAQDLVLDSDREFYVPAQRETDPVRSYNPSGNYRLTITAFSNFACPGCAEMSDNLSRLLSGFPEVRLVWKDYPDDSYPESYSSALAARCAQEQGKFWEYHDALFDNQEDLGVEYYKSVAESIGLNTSEFNACFEEGKYNSVVGFGETEARVYGIPKAPYFFVGDYAIIDRAISYEQLEEVVREILDNILVVGP